tara:strand:+ start:1621 stop:2145 length:525 start_codon:yes stop_codon:yes gene_type:complete
MANQRLTDKTEFDENLAGDDLLMIVDTSDTTGSSVGTSKKMKAERNIITTITTGNLDLNSNPLTLVAAPSEGYFIQPITISIIYKYNSTPSTTINFLYISYDSSSTGEYIIRHRDFIRNDSADRSYVFGPSVSNPADGAYAGDMEEKPLVLYTNADLSGNGTFKVYTTYQIVKA